MSLIVNNTNIDKILVNGSQIDIVKVNGTTVWTPKPPYYNELKSGSTLTEAQWLAFLNGDGIKYIIANGETSTFLGKKVNLTNSADNTYTTWSIGDFNHDSTNDTVDLILGNTIHAISFGSGQIYSSSSARTWLTGTYYNGFSTDIKNKIQTMAVVSNGSTLSDKIKLLSFTEVNGSTGTADTQYVTEGNRYPVFTDNNSRIRTGASKRWWLRSRNLNYTSRVWYVYDDGSVPSVFYDNPFGLIPAIRFA